MKYVFRIKHRCFKKSTLGYLLQIKICLNSPFTLLVYTAMVGNVFPVIQYLYPRYRNVYNKKHKLTIHIFHLSFIHWGFFV